MSEAPQFFISKLDAAKRQLDCAISLWVADRDVVSVHTLAGAAHEIVSDLNKKQGNKHPIFDADYIKDEYREEFRRMLRKDMMFFKHADKDPYAVIEFNPLASMMYMVSTIHMLNGIGESHSDMQFVFYFWMFFHKPKWINEGFVKILSERFPADVLDDVRSSPKKEFFETALKARAIHRANSIT